MAANHLFADFLAAFIRAYYRTDFWRGLWTLFCGGSLCSLGNFGIPKCGSKPQKRYYNCGNSAFVAGGHSKGVGWGAVFPTYFWTYCVVFFRFRPEFRVRAEFGAILFGG